MLLAQGVNWFRATRVAPQALGFGLVVTMAQRTLCHSLSLDCIRTGTRWKNCEMPESAGQTRKGFLRLV